MFQNQGANFVGYANADVLWNENLSLCNYNIESWQMSQIVGAQNGKGR